MENLKFKVVKVGASWCSQCRLVEWDGEELNFDTTDGDMQQTLVNGGMQELPVFLLIAIGRDGEETVVDMVDGLTNKADVDEWAVKSRMAYLEDYYGYDKSPNFDKIANARIKLRLDWNQCPCGGEGRGCISELCQKEIEEQGHCHCNCYFKRK